MMELFTLANFISLVTLSAMEVVLGIDNIVFIAIVAGKLPRELRDKARITGLALAIITRVLLLSLIFLLAHFTTPLFSILGHSVTGRELVLLCGGLFLIYKATKEIHEKFEDKTQGEVSLKKYSFRGVVSQILVIDIIFSLDSVITAVGMAESLVVMISAIIIAIGIMLAYSKYVVEFIDQHPTIKMLALSFLLLIGVMLVVEGTGKHVDKGYIYFAMAFSLFVEMLNIRLQKKENPLVHRSSALL